MKVFFKGIIKACAISILSYAGKRLVDELISCWHERKRKKEVTPVNHIVEETNKNVKSVPMKEIVNRNKDNNAKDCKRGLFAQGELHVICAQTGMGKSTLAVQIGLAIAGGKDSKHHASIKDIFGDSWNVTKQRVDYIEGENGEDELRNRYGKVNASYPDAFTVTPAGEIFSIDELEEIIRYRAEESKYRESHAIIIDHPGCYEGSDNHRRMQRFYKSLKNIILNYREGGTLSYNFHFGVCGYRQAMETCIFNKYYRD